MNARPAYARSLSLGEITFGKKSQRRIVKIATGEAYPNNCCNRTASVSPTCFIPSTAISLFMKNNPGKINKARAIVAIR